MTYNNFFFEIQISVQDVLLIYTQKNITKGARVAFEERRKTEEDDGKKIKICKIDATVLFTMHNL